MTATARKEWYAKGAARVHPPASELPRAVFVVLANGRTGVSGSPDTIVKGRHVRARNRRNGWVTVEVGQIVSTKDGIAVATIA
jgi:hypothetical protein